MKEIIKFERDILNGRDFSVRKKQGNTGYANHWHNYYEIMYYGNCKGTCNLNGKIYDIEDNCLFLLTPTDFHEIKNVDDEKSFSVNISFTENAVDKSILKEFITSAYAVYNINPRLKDLIEDMNTVYASPDSIKKDKLLYHTLNLILLNISEYGTPVSFNKTVLHPVINDALIYLITSKGRCTSLREIAEKYSISPSYFSFLFRKNIGMTYSKYMNKLKLDYAKRLLETTNMRVIDVCYECGFMNNAHFIRTFKENIGVSPSEFRKAALKEQKSVL